MTYYNQRTNLLLEGENLRNATIDRVSNPSESFVTKRNASVETFGRWDAVEELRGIASSKHLMHSGEVGGALIRVEIGGENASFHTLSPQKLARATGPSAVTDAAFAGTHDAVLMEGSGSLGVGHMKGQMGFFPFFFCSLYI